MKEWLYFASLSVIEQGDSDGWTDRNQGYSRADWEVRGHGSWSISLPSPHLGGLVV